MHAVLPRKDPRRGAPTTNPSDLRPERRNPATAFDSHSQLPSPVRHESGEQNCYPGTERYPSTPFLRITSEYHAALLFGMRLRLSKSV